MRTSIETITPARAQEMLSWNHNNRPVSSNHVVRLTQAMKSGIFQTTGQSIQVSDTGKLLDGQHRLKAIVDSGTTQTFVMVWDLPEQVFTVLDQGKTRSNGDVVSVAGYTQATARAALAKNILFWKAGYLVDHDAHGGVRTVIGCADKVLAFLQENSLDDELSFGTKAWRTNGGKFFSLAQWGFLFWVLGEKSLPDAYEFLNLLSSGANLPSGHILDVRNRLMGQDTTRKYSLRAKYQMVFKSWNLFRKGLQKGRTNVLPGETTPVLL